MIFITNELELKFGDGISALYFYADWLLFHKKMKLMIEKVELDHPAIKFYAVDVGDFKNSCQRFKIKTIPTIIIMIDGGKEVKRQTGLTNTAPFRKVFTDIYCLYGEQNAKKEERNQQENSQKNS
jgi:thiol-disulfide isomerase/thioredoxin